MGITAHSYNISVWCTHIGVFVLCGQQMQKQAKLNLKRFIKTKEQNCKQNTNKRERAEDH